MSRVKSYKYWNGLITGLGLSQLWTLWAIIIQMPSMKAPIEPLGIDIPKLTKIVINPLFYIGVPILIVSIIIALNFIFKDQEKKLVIMNSILVLIGWTILALIWEGMYSPLFDLLQKIG